MLKKLIIVFALFIWSVNSGFAAQLKVVDEAITSAVANQLPVDRIESYPADYGKLYCFTRIVGAKSDTEVTHVWYYQDDEMARVVLPVRSADWRTYSSKRFLPQWAGDWKVVVLDSEQNEIASLPFRLE